MSSFMRDLQASLSWQICFHFFLPLALLPRRRNGHLKRTNEFALGAIIASGAAPRCVLFLLSHCGDRSIAKPKRTNVRVQNNEATLLRCNEVIPFIVPCRFTAKSKDAVYNSRSQTSWKNFADAEITWQICRIWRNNSHKSEEFCFYSRYPIVTIANIIYFYIVFYILVFIIVNLLIFIHIFAIIFYFYPRKFGKF